MRKDHHYLQDLGTRSGCQQSHSMVGWSPQLLPFQLLQTRNQQWCLLPVKEKKNNKNTYAFKISFPHGIISIKKCLLLYYHIWIVSRFITWDYLTASLLKALAFIWVFLLNSSPVYRLLFQLFHRVQYLLIFFCVDIWVSKCSHQFTTIISHISASLESVCCIYLLSHSLSG